MAMSHTIVRNQKSKLGGDKVCLRHYEFEVTKKKSHYTVGYTSPELKREIWIMNLVISTVETKSSKQRKDLRGAPGWLSPLSI